MKKGIKVMSVAAMVLFAGVLFAESADSAGINNRQRHQQKRIGQGVRSGELTRPEVRKLECEQRRIHRKERRFKSDGEFTRKERAILQHDLNRSSRHVYKQKHDRQDRN